MTSRVAGWQGYDHTYRTWLRRPAVPLESIAPLGCGVRPGAGAIRSVPRPAAGSMLGVVAAGAVGLPAVMVAEFSPAATAAVALDRLAERLGVARELGRSTPSTRARPTRPGCRAASPAVRAPTASPRRAAASTRSPPAAPWSTSAPRRTAARSPPEAGGVLAGKRIVGPDPRPQ
ncbi:hypothetical protein AB0I54_23765 [Streptomyces sp. NPDC050625]|uniref:hypothetical protein n=1 Tax=Streptomyces sp. NPDC050625 TaxID=3154629 RepID=UPI00342177B3